MGVFKEFREFAIKGSVIDMAVGIIIGAAFGKVVSSLVNYVIMPPLGIVLGKVDFSNLYINLSGKSYPSLAEAKKAGAPIIGYGAFANAVLQFLIIAFAVFLLVKEVNRLKQLAKHPQASAGPTTKECPYCKSTIPINAIRCPNCTSTLESSESPEAQKSPATA